APDLTVRHCIFTSGNTLKITANKIKMTQKDKKKLSPLNKNTVASGKNCCKRSVNAKIVPFMINVTTNKKPRPITNEEDNNLSLRILSHPFFTFGRTCQILLIEFWISPKTVVAPNSSVAALTTKATLDFPDRDKFRITS